MQKISPLNNCSKKNTSAVKVHFSGFPSGMENSLIGRFTAFYVKNISFLTDKAELRIIPVPASGAGILIIRKEKTSRKNDQDNLLEHIRHSAAHITIAESPGRSRSAGSPQSEARFRTLQLLPGV
jgi:hypothetical protein